MVFDAGTRLHLALGRPELMDETDLILGTVAHPDHRIEDRIPGREHFYRRDLDPRRWLRVVVDFNDEPAWVGDRPSATEPATRLDTMTITVAGIPFDHHHYDERGDVLYLNVGEPRPAARGLETPDGHAIHYDETGAVIGLTLLNVRHTLAKEGSLTLTLPPEHLAADTLQPVLAA